jgi:UDP-N-acetylglucosamine 2-epimerase
MNKIKVVTVLGTRPELIRLSRVIPRLDQDFEHILVHTGQNFSASLKDDLFDDLRLRKPDYYLDAAGINANQTMSKILCSLDELLRNVKPEAALVLGDTNSGIGLLAAKKLSIPTFHMEAGNRCYDMRVPEEVNRRLLDHIADVNLPYSSIARQNLLEEGLPPDQIVVTGSPMREVLDFYEERIRSSSILNDLHLTPRSYFTVSLHREENVDSKNSLRLFSEIINSIALKFSLRIILSTHPRTRKQIETHKIVFEPEVQLLEPLPFTDYVKLQLHSKVTLSDSGTINEESALLGFPAINLRETHERHEAMEETSTIMTGMSVDRVHAAIDLLDTQHQGGQLKVPRDYEAQNVSTKISRIILSYTDYINRKNFGKLKFGS